MPRLRTVGIMLFLFAYAATWIGGSIATNENIRHEAEIAYRKAEIRNQEEVSAAKQFGTEPDFLIPLHEGGPIAKEWCVPLLPGLLFRHWESSIGPLGGGGGSSYVFYYGFGSIELSRFGGWRN